MANANKVTILEQLQDTATRIKQYILQQIADLADAVQADMDAKYTKPSGGIPKTDLASDVQTSLGKADTALQADSLKTINGESLVGSGNIPISKGYTTTEERETPIPEQTVTTQDAGGLSAASLTVVQDYSNDPPETLTVTFNGVEYNLTRSEPVAGCFLYGDYGFTAAPFALRIDRNAGSYISNLITPNPLTVTIKAESITRTVTPSEDFREAVMASVSSLPAVTSADNGKVLTVVDGAWAADALPVYNGEIVTPTYSVTVSLTNPINSSGFRSCYIYTIPDESDPSTYGEQIGNISSPSGSAEVSVSEVYGIAVQLKPFGVLSIPTEAVTCTGGVSKISIGNDTVRLMVTGDGAVVINQVNWDD